MNKKLSNAKIRLIKGATFVSAFGAVLLGAPKSVFAVEDITFLPSYINEIIQSFSGGNEKDYVNQRIRLGMTILFIVVFIVAIAYSALAAIKFITSQGDSGKLEESKGAVKAILMGFAAMLVSIVGVFLVIVIFGGSTGDIGTEVPVTIEDL